MALGELHKEDARNKIHNFKSKLLHSMISYNIYIKYKTENDAHKINITPKNHRKCLNKQKSFFGFVKKTINSKFSFN